MLMCVCVLGGEGGGGGVSGRNQGSYVFENAILCLVISTLSVFVMGFKSFFLCSCNAFINVYTGDT